MVEKGNLKHKQINKNQELKRKDKIIDKKTKKIKIRKGGKRQNKKLAKTRKRLKKILR